MIFLFFLIGLFFGSFFGVLSDRLPKNKDFIKGRSRCDFCKKELKWIDLIPVLSYVLIKGRCRYCKKKLSPEYPLIEITTALVFSLVYAYFYDKGIISLLFYLTFFSGLIVIFFSDLKHGIIPDKIVFPLSLLSLFYVFYQGNILISLVSAFSAFTLFLMLFLFTKGKGMGLGDVKLVFLLGLTLGFPGIFFSLYIAFLTGALVSIILILWGKKRFAKDTIPFGPFLVLGAFISIFQEDLILQIVKNLLHL